MQTENWIPLPLFSQIQRRFVGCSLSALICICAGCSTYRPSVPPGVVPSAPVLTSEDEQYGHEVLAELTRQYALDRDDTNIERVRGITDRLTEAAHAANDPWHVYVLVSESFKNAAATRGNSVFVWTGLLDSIHDDNELATVLAHEIGHVLAGHTKRNPAEEANSIMAQTVGNIAGTVVNSQGVPSIVGQLAGILVQAGVEAIAVNPGQRAKEQEADEIGLFLMADAGYDPQSAVDFWDRVKSDPEFGGNAITFLSSHPSSSDRFKHLQSLLPDARLRYENFLARKQKHRSRRTH